MGKKIILLCFCFCGVLYAVLHELKHSKSHNSSEVIPPLMNSKNKNDLILTTCNESLYRVVSVNKLRKTNNIITFTANNDEIISPTNNVIQSYSSNQTLTAMIIDAKNNNNWEAILYNIKIGKIPYEGMIGDQMVSLFDLLYLSSPPKYIIEELVAMNIFPTMYSFEFISQFQYLGLEKLLELEEITYPDLTYKVHYKNRVVNLATHSIISNNPIAYSYWKNKGLKIERKLLHYKELHYAKNAGINLSTLPKELQIKSPNSQKYNPNKLLKNKLTTYDHFNLLKIKDCKNSKNNKVIDAIPNNELNDLLKDIENGSIENMNLLDNVNPLYTEIYINNITKNRIYETINNSTLTDKKLFFNNITQGAYNKDSRIYFSSPQNGITLLEYALYFGADERIISYMFDHNFPLRLSKLVLLLSSKAKRNNIFGILEDNNFNFDALENGKGLMHFAIISENVELINFLEAKGVILIEQYGVDALEHILRKVNPKQQLLMLDIIKRFNPPIKKQHIIILNNIKKYEADIYNLLVNNSFLSSITE